MKAWVEDYIRQFKAVLDAVPAESLAQWVEVFRKAHKENRQIFVFGNGGSAANCSHFVCDLGKGSSISMGSPFRCLSLNDNVAWMTAIANDFSYEDLFVRQLENYAKPGDLIFTLSVSGNSPNCVKAMEWGKKQGLTLLAVTGAKRGKMAELADHLIVIDSTHYGRVEDAQMMVAHILCYAFMEKAKELKG
jgi:D-sedoheptulose 7-phosphate isomerase